MSAHPQELRELLRLLSDGQIDETQAQRAVERLLLALEDPETYVSTYPNDEWLVEGCDLFASNEGSMRLLHWIVHEELADWLVTGKSIDDMAIHIVDRLHAQGIAVADPPRHLLSLAECRRHLTNALAAVNAPRDRKALVEFQFGNGVGLFIVAERGVERIAAISTPIGLRFKAW